MAEALRAIRKGQGAACQNSRLVQGQVSDGAASA